MIYGTDQEGIVKDMGNRAVLNTDHAALLRYQALRRKKNEASLTSRRIEKLERENTTLKNDMQSLNTRIDELMSILGLEG